jgi:hypothetical protein
MWESVEGGVIMYLGGIKGPAVSDMWVQVATHACQQPFSGISPGAITGEEMGVQVAVHTKHR